MYHNFVDSNYNYHTDENEVASQVEVEPEIKVLNMNSITKCHERQIQRLQRDQSKRIQDYNFLRNKLENNTQNLQNQINGIRTELSKLHQKAAQLDQMQQRLVHCEEQNVQMQIHNDSEFEVLRDVLKHVCGRMDCMEELYRTEKEHFQLKNHQEATIAPMIQAQISSAGSSQGKSRFLSARAQCPQCHRELSKRYLKRHQQTNRCKYNRNNLGTSIAMQNLN